MSRVPKSGGLTFPSDPLAAMRDLQNLDAPRSDGHTVIRSDSHTASQSDSQTVIQQDGHTVIQTGVQIIPPSDELKKQLLRMAEGPRKTKTFKIAVNLDREISQYCAENWADRPEIQEIIERGLQLFFFEKRTGQDLLSLEGDATDG